MEESSLSVIVLWWEFFMHLNDQSLDLQGIGSTEFSGYHFELKRECFWI